MIMLSSIIPTSSRYVTSQFTLQTSSPSFIFPVALFKTRKGMETTYQYFWNHSLPTYQSHHHLKPVHSTAITTDLLKSQLYLLTGAFFSTNVSYTRHAGSILPLRLLNLLTSPALPLSLGHIKARPTKIKTKFSTPLILKSVTHV